MTMGKDSRNLGTRATTGAADGGSRSYDVASFATAAIDAQRGPLTRCATWFLGDRLAAQRLVDAALHDAVASGVQPSDPAGLRRWLFGLVKRSVLDALLREARAEPLRDDSDEDGGDGAPAFLADGHWCNEPAAWGDPRFAAGGAALQRAIEGCIDKLPVNTARVYTLREILGLETREICETLGLPQHVCTSMLCRARLAVHQRLQREVRAAQPTQ